MRAQGRIGSGLSWAIAWLLAIAGPCAFLLWPGTLTWWAGAALLLPVVGLALWRHEHKGFGEEHASGDGPWSPPPDLG